MYMYTYYIFIYIIYIYYILHIYIKKTDFNVCESCEHQKLHIFFK